MRRNTIWLVEELSFSGNWFHVATRYTREAARSFVRSAHGFRKVDPICKAEAKYRISKFVRVLD